MSITATSRGTGNDTTSASSFNISVPQNLTAGTMAVLVLGFSNNSSSVTLTSVTDSLGNSWLIGTQYKRTDIGNTFGNGTNLAIAYSLQRVGALTTSDTITCNFSTAIENKAWALKEISYGHSIILSQSGSTNGVGDVDTPTITTSTVYNERIVLAAMSAERGDSITAEDSVNNTNGSWSTHQTDTTGTTGINDVQITTQHKILTGTSTQTYSPVHNGSGDSFSIAWIEFTEKITNPVLSNGLFGF